MADWRSFQTGGQSFEVSFWVSKSEVSPYPVFFCFIYRFVSWRGKFRTIKWAIG